MEIWCYNAYLALMRGVPDGRLPAMVGLDFEGWKSILGFSAAARVHTEDD